MYLSGASASLASCRWIHLQGLSFTVGHRKQKKQLVVDVAFQLTGMRGFEMGRGHHSKVHKHLRSFVLS